MILKTAKRHIIAVLVLLPLISFCQKEDAILKIGHKISVRSKVLNETRDIWIYLPPSYADRYCQSTPYPVLYVLDGDAHFHSLSGMIQILGSGVNWSFVIPEMIIVAIPNTNRTRDLTPTNSIKGPDDQTLDYQKSSGGSTNFLRFLKDELAPKIDSSYRTIPYRILTGHSYGGLTVIHALYTIPQTFNAYISIDPSLWWDNRLLVTQGKGYFKSTNLMGKSLFLAQANTLNVGETNNGFDSIKEFAIQLENSNTSGLRWNYQYYSDDNHGSLAFIAEYDALRFIFKNYFVNFNEVASAKEMKERYTRFSNETKVSFNPPERVVQLFGSVALSLKKYDVAQEYFQMNIENYPKSSSAYANMGQLWKIKGDNKKALEYYEKSVTIYPDNEDSRNNVKSLKEKIQLKK